MERAALVAVHRQFRQAAANDRAAVGLDLVDIVDVARRDQIDVLRRHVDGFLGHLARRLQRTPPRIVDARPPVRPAGDEIRQQDAGNRAVREPHSSVARRHEDVLRVHRIRPDERDAVVRLHDLAAPLHLDGFEHRKALARPRRQPVVTLLRVAGLTRLVILTADEEQIVRTVAIDRDDTQVVIRIRRVPEQRVRNRSTRYAHGDHVGHVRRLLRVDGESIVDRRVGGDDGRGRGDLV